jgi:hypothetical protein
MGGGVGGAPCGGPVELGELRDVAAAALAPAIDTDPMVFADIVEATVPPALVIEWDDPWLEPGAGLPTMGPCIYTARLRVVMIAGRLDPGAGYDEIDRLAAYVLGRMRADPTRGRSTASRDPTRSTRPASTRSGPMPTTPPKPASRSPRWPNPSR